MSLNSVINVAITRETASIQQAGFGIPLLVGVHTAWTDRIRYYSQPDDMLTDGFASTDALYLKAQALFRQNPTVVQFAIGRRITAEAYATTLAAIKAVSNLWYGVAIVERGTTDILAVAAWIEANGKLFPAISGDGGIVVPTTTTDLASQLQALAYARTVPMYDSQLASDDHKDAAWLGKMLPTQPGSSTWAFKTLNGCAPAALNDTQIAAAKAKNCSVYVTVAGVNVTLGGFVADGEFADIIHGTDWLTARMAENAFSSIINVPKVPYTDAGIAIITTSVNRDLKAGVAVGLLADDTPFTITAPKAVDVPQVDRANRVLNGVSFSARYAGAIHAVNLTGTISL